MTFAQPNTMSLRKNRVFVTPQRNVLITEGSRSLTVPPGTDRAVFVSICNTIYDISRNIIYEVQQW